MRGNWLEFIELKQKEAGLKEIVVYCWFGYRGVRLFYHIAPGVTAWGNDV
jgi:hypothetical protein